MHRKQTLCQRLVDLCRWNSVENQLWAIREGERRCPPPVTPGVEGERTIKTQKSLAPNGQEHRQGAVQWRDSSAGNTKLLKLVLRWYNMVPKADAFARVSSTISQRDETRLEKIAFNIEEIRNTPTELPSGCPSPPLRCKASELSIRVYSPGRSTAKIANERTQLLLLKLWECRNGCQTSWSQTMHQKQTLFQRLTIQMKRVLRNCVQYWRTIHRWSHQDSPNRNSGARTYHRGIVFIAQTRPRDRPSQELSNVETLAPVTQIKVAPAKPVHGYLRCAEQPLCSSKLT